MSLPSCSPSLCELQAAFLAAVLPKVLAHGQVYFRGLKCPHKKEEYISEMIGLCWHWHLRLAEKGKDATQYPTALATYAAKAVKSGRRLAGMEKAKDVLSTLAQQRHNFTVQSLLSSTRTSHDDLFARPHGQQRQDAFEERLQDNTLTPIPEQVAFRIDFPAWLETLTGRERCLIRAMILNERTTDLSRLFDVSPGRISQLRRDFEQGWQRFCASGDKTAP